MDFRKLSKRFKPAGWAALAVLAAALSWFRVFEAYELQTYDWRFVLRGERPASKDIVFVDIWDDSLQALGAWPFSRAYHALLIDALHRHGATAVALDMFFVEPRGDEDALAVETAQAAGNAYFVEAFYKVKDVKGRFESERKIAPLLPEYAAAAKAVAHVNSTPDEDGKTRRTYPVISLEGKDCYALGFRIAMDLLGVKESEMRLVPGKELRFGDKLRVPLDDDGYFIVNFAGRWEQGFPHYSYAEVLASAQAEEEGKKPILDLEKLRGKICFVGLTALGTQDTNPVPMERVYPMVGLHANVLNSLLMRDFIRRLDRASNLAVLFLFGAALLVVTTKLRPVLALGGFFALILVYVATATLAFLFFGAWMDLFYPVVALAVLYAGLTLARVLHEMRRRELIESELKIASKIQQSFLPETLPTQPGIEIAVFMQPAKAVGGDLYTFVPLGDDKLGVMAGDVSGKGTPAALFMAKAVSEFKFSARDERNPAAAVQRLNESVASESTGGLFVTLTYAIFDLKAQTMALANAGHLPLVSVSADGSSALVTCEEGMPIGVMPGIDFGKIEVGLKDGDCFAFYSDGVSEARDRKKNEYGVEALQKMMTAARTLPAAAILEKCVQDLTRFMGKADQHDDITLIVVKVAKPGEPA